MFLKIKFVKKKKNCRPLGGGVGDGPPVLCIFFFYLYKITQYINSK